MIVVDTNVIAYIWIPGFSQPIYHTIFLSYTGIALELFVIIAYYKAM